MLKETETEETIGFFATFSSLVAFKLEGGGLRIRLPLATPMESRTQGSRPRPRTQKKSEAKNSPFEDRPSRSQGQECLRPRIKDTGASALQKKGLQNFFFRRTTKF